MKRRSKILLLVAPVIVVGLVSFGWMGIRDLFNERVTLGTAQEFSDVPWMAGLLAGLEVSSKVKYKQIGFHRSDRVYVTASVTNEAWDEYVQAHSELSDIASDKGLYVGVVERVVRDLDPGMPEAWQDDTWVFGPGKDRNYWIGYNRKLQRLWAYVPRRDYAGKVME